jgi:hypothetical protein
MTYSKESPLYGPTVAVMLIALFIFIYVAVRAAALSITHDEALTCNWHVTGDWARIVLFRTDGLPDNNHVLHTLLCKVFVSLFGLSEFTLRIPSLIGCACYLFGLVLCLRHLVSGWKTVFGLLVAGMNPYILDFLGLARGYGLGLGFSMLGLAALLESFKESSGTVRLLPSQVSMVFFTLATLANLSFLLVYGAAFTVITTSLLWTATTEMKKGTMSDKPWESLLKIFGPTLPFMAYLILPLSIIHRQKLFDMGGQNGFWTDTVKSLIYGTIYGREWLIDSAWLLEAWIILTVVTLPFVIVALKKSDAKRSRSLLIIATMISLIALESLAQHLLFNIAWLEGRRGIFLLPLFLLAALSLGELHPAPSRLLFFPGLLNGIVFPCLIAVNGMISMNVTHVFDWPDYTGTRNIMQYVRDRIAREHPSVPLHMRVNWVFEPGMNFYRHTMGLESSLLPFNRKGLEGPADLYFGYAADQDKIAAYGVRPLLREQFAGTVLFEKNVTSARKHP